MKKLVIVGGGFSGSMIAKNLESEFDTTLIDNKNYFEFTPGILRTLVNPENMKRIQVLHKDYLDKTKIVFGSVMGVDEKSVKVGRKNIPYDYLVICSGSRYDIPIKQGDVVYTTRADTLKKYHNKLEKSDNITIVGGGLVGVELAAELSTSYPNKHINIVHSGSRLLERNSHRVSDYAQRFLENSGVRIFFNEFAINFDKDVITNKKTRIKSDLVFVCTGVKPNSEFVGEYLANRIEKSGHIRVNPYLQVEGFQNIFASGDVNNIMEEKTAQNAIKQAEIVVKNIKSLEEGYNLHEYNSSNRPLVISLGKWNGIFVWKNFSFFGLIPGLLKSLIERFEMRRWRK